MNPPAFRLLLAAALLLTATVAQAAPKPAPAPVPPNSDIVELPTFTVTDSRVLPPPEWWTYATLPGYEFISNVSERTTKRFIDDFQRHTIAISLIWPQILAGKTHTPTLILLCKGDSFRPFIPENDNSEGSSNLTPGSLYVEDKERCAIVINMTQQELFADMAASNPAETTDAETPSSLPDILRSVDPNREFLRQYTRLLMRRANGNSPLPPWLEEGLARTFESADLDKKTVEFARIGINGNTFGHLGLPGEEPNGARNGPNIGQIMPFEKMFSNEPEDHASSDGGNFAWKTHCYAFVHMCLFGIDTRYQQGFVDFVKLACARLVDENDFKKCFGVNYEKMRWALRDYFEQPNHRITLLKAKRGQTLPEPTPVALRDATQAEIGRIKGETFRLAGHHRESRDELIAPYLRQHSDASLLASLGLLEALEGRKDRARKFLEAAAKENAVRPRAYLELARLRLDEALAAPKGENGRLSASQTVSVLDPLFTARTQPPSMPEVYSIIGYTWGRSAMRPKPAQLNALLEGTALFPRDTALIQQATELFAESGDIATAQRLIKLGITVSTDRATREYFERKRASLPQPQTAAN